MWNSLSFVLARAHLRKRRTQNIVTVLGVAIGVMVLTTALSLFNGFTAALIQATLKATPHVSLQLYDQKPLPALERAISSDPDIAAWSPVLGDTGLLFRRAEAGRKAEGNLARVFGSGPKEAEVLNLSPLERQQLSNLQEGEVLLGRILADSISAFKGDTVFLLNLEQRRLKLKVSGTFRTGNALIDGVYAFTRLETLRSVNNRELTWYHLKLKNLEDAPKVALRYSGFDQVGAQPWQDINAGVIGQLALQKTVLGIVVFLIVVVAAFGIANVLLLTVLEKTAEIAILRAMGASRGSIIGAFVLEGGILGVGGFLLGNVLGLALALYFQWKPVQIPGDLYFISSLSTEIQAGDFIWANVLSFSVTILASFIPARRAAGIEPARVIR